MEELTPQASTAALAPQSPRHTLAELSASPYFLHLASQQSDKGRRTVASHLRAAARLLHARAPALFASDEPRAFPWQLVDRLVFEALKEALLASGLAISTVLGRLAAVRGVLRAARDLGQISEDQLRAIERSRPPKGERLTAGSMVSAADQERLFACCDPRSVKGARDGALFALLLGCGLRRSEASALELEQLEREGPVWSLRVIGKGNKERRVFLPEGARRWLAAWLEQRGRAPGPLLLATDHGRALLWRRLSSEGIAYLAGALGQQAGARPHSCHDYRRTFASQLWDANVDGATIQKLMGHASITTTAAYDRRPDRARALASAHIPIPFDELAAVEAAAAGEAPPLAVELDDDPAEPTGTEGPR